MVYFKKYDSTIMTTPEIKLVRSLVKAQREGDCSSPSPAPSPSFAFRSHAQGAYRNRSSGSSRVRSGEGDDMTRSVATASTASRSNHSASRASSALSSGSSRSRSPGVALAEKEIMQRLGLNRSSKANNHLASSSSRERDVNRGRARRHSNPRNISHGAASRHELHPLISPEEAEADRERFRRLSAGGRNAGIFDSPSSKSILSGESGVSASSTRSVQKLLRLRKHKHPVRVHCAMCVRDVVRMMCEGRADAAVLVGNSGRIAGLLTASDVVVGVVAQSQDPSSLSASEIMTVNPACAQTSMLAADAFRTMLVNRSFHLPVVGKRGVVKGILDARLCLHDTIVRLEYLDDVAEFASEAAGVEGENAVPVGDIAQSVVTVSMDGTIGDAAIAMRENSVSLVIIVRRSFSVLGGGDADDKDQPGEMPSGVPRSLVHGVVTASDILRLVDTQGKHASSVPVVSLSHPLHDVVRTDCPALDALHVMNDSRSNYAIVETFGLSSSMTTTGKVNTMIVGMVGMLECAAAAFGHRGVSIEAVTDVSDELGSPLRTMRRLSRDFDDDSGTPQKSLGHAFQDRSKARAGSTPGRRSFPMELNASRDVTSSVGSSADDPHFEENGLKERRVQERERKNLSPGNRVWAGFAPSKPALASFSSTANRTPVSHSSAGVLSGRSESPATRILGQCGDLVQFKLVDSITASTYRFIMDKEDIVELAVVPCGEDADTDSNSSEGSLGWGVPTKLLRGDSVKRVRRQSTETTDIRLSLSSLWEKIEEETGRELSKEADLFYVDDDDDAIRIMRAQDILCAIALARQLGWSKITLKTLPKDSKTTKKGVQAAPNQTILPFSKRLSSFNVAVVAAGASVVLLSVALSVLLRPKSERKR